MAWTDDFYKPKTAPVFEAPEGSQMGDLERKILKLEEDYKENQLNKAAANLDTTLSEAQKAREMDIAQRNMDSLEARKAPLMAVLQQFRDSGQIPE